MTSAASNEPRIITSIRLGAQDIEMLRVYRRRLQLRSPEPLSRSDVLRMIIRQHLEVALAEEAAESSIAA